MWLNLVAMALYGALGHAARGDVTATVASLGYASIAEAHARLAEDGQWVLNEKGIVVRAGLDGCDALLASVGDSPAALNKAVRELGNVIGSEPAVLRP